MTFATFNPPGEFEKDFFFLFVRLRFLWTDRRLPSQSSVYAKVSVDVKRQDRHRLSQVSRFEGEERGLFVLL